MKLRNGFVSNSSSSSFIVIKQGKLDYIEFEHNNPVVLGELGESNFGWQQDRYSNFNDKVNWAYLQFDKCLNCRLILGS